MYNAHRGMVPAPLPNGRLTELLDQIRAEFEGQQNKSEDYERNMAQQMQEMEMVRQKVFNLEQAQLNMKQRYEDDINRLRHELEARGGPPSHVSVSGLPPHGGPSQNQPPSIGHGPSNLFGGIMANPPGQGNPGLVPLSQEQQQQGPPQNQMPQPPPGLHQPPFQNYPGGPVNGYGGQNSQVIASPGPGKGRNPRGPPGPPGPGPATPQQPQPIAYPERGSPRGLGRQTPPHQQMSVPDVGNVLADLDPDTLPPHQKHEAQDWFAVFNPRIRRVLDVDIMHTLHHESVIFEVSTGRQITKLQDETVDKDGDLYIRSVCFSPDGKYLATGAEDKQIRVWDIEARTIRHTFTGHEQDIYSLDFARNGKHIASGSGDRTVRVWDLDSGREILNLVIEDGVTTVAMSPNGDFVAAGSLDKSVRVWDTRNGMLVERLDGQLEGHKDSVYSVAFAPDGRSLVSGSLDKTIKMWELGSGHGMMGNSGGRGGRCIRTFEGHKDFVLSVALTPDGKWVLSGSKDRGVQFWQPVTGDCHLMLQGHKNSVISVAPCPTGELFATGSGDMRARIWK
ncbi:hypothetical protein G7Y79_00007g021880 [Physcia stellaris]|nr:hypothetical protein G7Y79_00007g021880 [Physcia stellaris]